MIIIFCSTKWAQASWNKTLARHFYTWQAIGIKAQSFWSWVQCLIHLPWCTRPQNQSVQHLSFLLLNVIMHFNLEANCSLLHQRLHYIHYMIRLTYIRNNTDPLFSAIPHRHECEPQGGRWDGQEVQHYNPVIQRQSWFKDVSQNTLSKCQWLHDPLHGGHG